MTALVTQIADGANAGAPAIEMRPEALAVTASGRRVLEIDALMLKGWLDRGEALLVDVREPHEYEIERVAGAMLMPMSFFDPETFPSLPGKKLVLMCAIGKRSMAAAKQLLNAGFTEAINLKGGIQAWKDAGLPTDTD